MAPVGQQRNKKEREEKEAATHGREGSNAWQRRAR